jgi:hypothetical protein
MIFGSIDRILLLGGSRATAEMAAALQSRSRYRVEVFTAPRQEDDAITETGETFRAFLGRNSIAYRVADDINTDPHFLAAITPGTMALGVGEAWSFAPDIVAKFGGRLLDLMGIRLPQYRGGAHYTWQILTGNRRGACNLQVVNAEMRPGVHDSGSIVKCHDYLFPASARIPADYFGHAVREEVRFILEFLDEVAAGKDFEPRPLQNAFSLYFPRLNTRQNAFLDWQWPTREIERMICAFDRPYVGASTSINGALVRVRSASAESGDGAFHPFQRGLIYRIDVDHLFVATRDGAILVGDVRDADGTSVKDGLRVGDRFFTPTAWIEQAMQHRESY